MNPQLKLVDSNQSETALNLTDFIEDGKSAGLSPRLRAILSHRLRRQQRKGGQPPSILQSELPQVDDPLPTPAEQANSLILWIGDHQDSQGAAAIIPAQALSAVIGTAISPTSYELSWLLMQEEVSPLFEQRFDPDEGMSFLLTFAGWQRYDDLKHAQVESHSAFMAMKFDSELDCVVKDCFKPAVEAAGFKLRDLREGQSAGLIDDQLRVALRTSRFVIADLTHGSNGAYWEAGFAEGLGRPVIYTCSKEKWVFGIPEFRVA